MNNLHQPTEPDSGDDFTLKQVIFLVLGPPLLIMIGMTVIRLIAEASFGHIEWNSPFMAVEFLIVVPVLYLVRKKRLAVLNVFRFYSVSFGILLWSCLLGVSASILGDQLDRIVQLFFPLPSEISRAMEQIFLTNNKIDFAFMVVIATLGAGLVEEMLFRGFLQQIFEAKTGKWTAIITSSLFFGIIHLNPWMMIQIVLLGVVLGYLAWQTNSIFPTIIVHALNNLIAILYIRWHTASFDNVYLKEGLVSPFVVLGAIAVFILSWRQIQSLSSRPERRQ